MLRPLNKMVGRSILATILFIAFAPLAAADGTHRTAANQAVEITLTAAKPCADPFSPIL